MVYQRLLMREEHRGWIPPANVHCGQAQKSAIVDFWGMQCHEDAPASKKVIMYPITYCLDVNVLWNVFVERRQKAALVTRFSIR